MIDNLIHDVESRACPRIHSAARLIDGILCRGFAAEAERMAGDGDGGMDIGMLSITWVKI